MDSDLIWKHVDTERVELADLLDGLSPEQWLTPSLCPGWTVRDVGAHLAMAQSRLRDVWRPMLRARGHLDAMILQTATASPATHEEITATLRGFVGSRRRAPFVGELEPLVDVLVHTQDVCVPLGIEHPMPPDAAEAAADRLVVLNRHRMTRMWRPRAPVRLRATDVDWAHGEGPEVTGPVQALVLVLAGRGAAALPRLDGATYALAA